MHIVDNGTFNMYGGVIKRNRVTGTGGQGLGGAIRIGLPGGGTFNMMGGIIYGECHPLYANTATVDGATLSIASGTARFGTAGNWTNFPATENRTIEVRDGVLIHPAVASVTTNGVTRGFLTLQAALTAANVAGEHIITLHENSSLAARFDFTTVGTNATVTIQGAGGERIISLSQNTGMFEVGNGSTLILGENITLRGHSDNNRPLIRIIDGGHLIMNDGAVMENNQSAGAGTPNYDGGAIRMFGTARFTMNGGIIRNNSGGRGGGIHMGGGTIQMAGGTIYGTDGGANANIATTNYAALYGILYYGTFVGGTFYPAGTISNENRTIRMVGGELDSPLPAATVSTNGGVPRHFQTLQAALAAANVAGEHTVNIRENQYLTQVSLVDGADIILTAPSSVTVTLSANGHMFLMPQGTTLTLNENITLRGRDNNTGVLVGVTGGEFIMEGGTITGNSFGGAGGGVGISQGSRFTMNGGTIYRNTAGTQGGGVFVGFYGEPISTFTMNGGIITNNTAASGGGVFVSGGTFNMTNGTIDDNNATASGGGIYLYRSTLNMTDGTIIDNRAYNTGAGVFVGSYANFIMQNGTISGNNGHIGGGVGINNGTFTMQNGTINTNTARGGGGGGVFVSGGGTFTMYNGTTIRTNSSPFNQGGGIQAWGGNIVMRGGAISGNRGGGIFVIGSLRIMDGRIYGSDETDPTLPNYYGAALHFYGDTAQHGTFNASGDFTPLGSLTSENHTIEVVGGALIRPEPTTTAIINGTLMSFQNLQGALNAANVSGTHTINILTDQTLPHVNLASGANITLNATTPVTVQLPGPGNMFRVSDGATLTVGNNVILNGVNNNNVPLIIVYGNLNLNGGTISNNTISTTVMGGGGVFVANGGNFTMTSGTISGNATADGGGGGGVIVYGTFTMYNGTISGNSTSNTGMGGGVQVSGTFTMHGGTISDNTTGGWGGGGVGVWTGGTMYMHGGTISRNQAAGGGGGLEAWGGTVRTISGTIYGTDGGINANIDNGISEADTLRVGNNGRAYFGTAAGWTSFHPSLTELTENRTIEVVNGVLIRPGGTGRALTLSDNLGGGFAVILSAPPQPFGIQAFGIQAFGMQNETVTIAALPADGYVFFYWQNGYGEIISVTPEFTFTILPNMTQAALTLTAFYIPDPLALFALPVLPPAALPEEDDDYPQKEEEDDDYPHHPPKEEDDPHHPPKEEDDDDPDGDVAP
jgi:hypothetical protein